MNPSLVHFANQAKKVAKKLAENPVTAGVSRRLTNQVATDERAELFLNGWQPAGGKFCHRPVNVKALLSNRNRNKSGRN